MSTKINHWDLDCVLVGDAYYAISGGEQVPLLRSKELKNWTHVGDFLRPETGTARLGTTQVPFSPAELPNGVDVELRIFIEKHLVEIFANDQQALLIEHADFRDKPDLHAFSVGAPVTLKRVEIWKLKPTNQGFRMVQKNRIWQPQGRGTKTEGQAFNQIFGDILKC